MKINEKFEKYEITTGCDNLSSEAKYQMSNKEAGRFISLIFILRTSRRLPCLTGSAYSAFIIKGSA